MTIRKLEHLLDKKEWLSFVLADFGIMDSTTHLDRLEPTVLLRDICSVDGELLADHCWCDYNLSFDKVYQGDKLVAYCGAYWYNKSGGTSNLAVDPVWVQNYTDTPIIPNLAIPTTPQEILDIFPDMRVHKWDQTRFDLLKELVEIGVGLKVNLNFLDPKCSIIAKCLDLYRDKEVMEIIRIAQVVNGVPVNLAI